MSPTEKRDPVPDSPLNDPAESLKQQRANFFDNKVEFWALIGGISVGLAILDWWRWANSLPPTPIISSALAAGIIVFSFYRVWRLRPQLFRLDLGIKGERHVGHLLEHEAGPLGYRVFHDICDDRGNIDHVLIGPGGIFAIETKARSKRHGNPKVRFNGWQITEDGYVPDRDPVAQAMACAAALGRILKLDPNTDVMPFPVVLYPGWYVDSSKHSKIWVLNDKAIKSFLENEPEKLSPTQIKSLSKALAEWIRERKRAV